MNEALNFEAKTTTAELRFLFIEKNFRDYQGTALSLSLSAPSPSSIPDTTISTAFLLVYKFLGFLNCYLTVYMLVLTFFAALRLGDNSGGFMAANLNFIASLIIHLSFYI
jgi:hypothetical protein